MQTPIVTILPSILKNSCMHERMYLVKISTKV